MGTGPARDPAAVARLAVELGGSGRAGPWLIVGAHPDDETLGASFVLGRAPDLTVVHVTDGAPHDQRLWSPRAPAERRAYADLRAREAEAALAVAGVSPAAIVRLGLVDQEASHELVALSHRLRELIERRAPAVVITHPYEGGHPDHDAAAFAVAAAIAALPAERRPLALEMTSYHRQGDRLVTGRFLPAAVAEVERRFDAAARATKQAMLDCFASQREIIALFDTEAERYRVAPRHDFSQAPHVGVLHYESMGWPLTGAAWRAGASAALVTLGLAPSAHQT